MREKVHSLDKWLTAGLDLLFPIRCAGCGATGAVWCDVCDRQLVRVREPWCETCGLSLEQHGSCPACRRQPPRLRVRSCARYTGCLVSALLHLKYRPDRRLARELAGWMAQVVRRAGWESSLVVPVPLGERRKQSRGFNQARLLSEQLARALQLPHQGGLLKRVQETRTQVGLTPAERWQNVRGAFAAAADSFAGEQVLLVDDLMTTGATLSACAEALRAAGAHQVWGVTVGRA